MPRLRSVIDLLAEQSEESLRQMRDSVQAELARLTVEAEQIDQALARKSRKNRTGGGRLTRDQVYDVVTRSGRALTTAEAHELVAAEGISASANAVRNHLTRLADDGRLLRFDGGRFGLPYVGPEPAAEESDFVKAGSAAADDDIPF